MDKRIYLLTIIAFIVGMVELIVGGILDLIADDLGVTLGNVGLLITIFSLVYGISAPILLIATAKVERKKLTLIALLVFFFGNLLAIVSQTYSVLLIARIISASSGSILVVLCITLASSVVAPKYVGRAIGLVIMGISGSIVLGIPIGLVLGNAFGWRAPFALIASLTLVLMLAVHFFMKPIQPEPSVPIKIQLSTLKRSKILFAQLTTFFFLAGHMTLYAFLTPFLKSFVGLDSTWVSVIYFIFGIAAVAGGGIGGVLTDRFRAKNVLLLTIIIFSITMFAIPYTAFIFPLFLTVIVVWGVMSWTITPAMQSYLIEAAPETAAIQQSINNSVLHFGIAFGSFIGSVIIEHQSVQHNTTVGTLFIVLSLGSLLFSLSRERNEKLVPQQTDIN